MRKPHTPRSRVTPSRAAKPIALPSAASPIVLPGPAFSTWPSPVRASDLLRRIARPVIAVGSFFGITTLPDKPHTVVQKVVHVMEWSAIAVCILLAMVEPVIGLWPFILAVQVTALFVVVMRMPPDTPQRSLDDDPAIAMDKPLLERRERRAVVLEANRRVVIDQ